jgi:hypothetical protein
MDKTELVFKTNKDIIMFYQTGFRNIGLTTMISFASLAYSRFYRGKSQMYSSGLVLVSILTILSSMILNRNLHNSMTRHHNINSDLNAANNYLIINKLFLVIQIILIFFAIYTLYRLNTNNQYR